MNEDVAKRDPKIVLDYQADNAERGAAQREWVARAGWPLADGPKPDQRIDLVGERDGDAERSGRTAIAWSPGRVVLGDGRRRPGVLMVWPVSGVAPTYDALQFRELDGHLAHQVRLAQMGRAADPHWVRAGDRRTDDFGQSLNSVGLLTHRSQACVEDELIEPGYVVLERPA